MRTKSVHGDGSFNYELRFDRTEYLELQWRADGGSKISHMTKTPDGNWSWVADWVGQALSPNDLAHLLLKRKPLKVLKAIVFRRSYMMGRIDDFDETVRKVLVQELGAASYQAAGVR